MAYKPNEIKRLEQALNISDDSYSYTTNHENRVIGLALYEPEYTLGIDINENFEVISIFKDLQKLEISLAGLNAIAHLSSLSELEYIEIEYGDIESIEPLRNLKKLNYLNFAGSQISDLEPLAHLENLKYVNLSQNKVSNITHLNALIKLEELHLAFNQIDDIEVLANLKNLKCLTVNNNQLSSANSLQELTLLETVNISDNNIQDISFLGSLEKLKHLSLTNNGVNDVSIIHNLKELVSLNLAKNGITSILGFEKLTQLVYLDISNNNISEITQLSDLVLLQRLKIDQNPIHDISTLKDLVQLDFLDASNIKAINFDVISNFIGLTYLRLNKNSLSNIQFLSTLNKLLHLFLDHNKITDISPLYNNSLITLSLESNQVNEIFLLAKMFYLSSLNLINNPVGGGHYKKYPLADNNSGESHFYQLFLNVGEQYLSDGNYDYARACFIYLLTDKFRYTDAYDTNMLRQKVEALTNELNKLQDADSDFTHNKGVSYYYNAISVKTTDFNLSLKLLETLMQMGHPLQYVLYSDLNKYINHHFVLKEQEFKLSLLKATKANAHPDIDFLVKKREYADKIQADQRWATSSPRDGLSPREILLIFAMILGLLLLIFK